MANKIVNIGQQTTNLLSNDNLIVYRDISMKSSFNPTAAAVETNDLPIESSYYVVLRSEDVDVNDVSCIMISGDYSSDDENEKYGLYIHNTDNYLTDMKNYVGKMSLSKFRVEKNINVKAVQESLHNIFTWIPGERILNPEFGSTLYRYLYSGITEYNSEQIIAEIRKCISKLEPRVQLEQVINVSTVEDTENNTVHLEIVYSIPSLNSKQYSYTYVYHKQTI